MGRKRKIIIILAIILALSVGIYFLFQSRFLLNIAHGIIEDQLTNLLKTEVRLGRLSGNLFYKVKIEELTIADKTVPRQKIISVEELDVRYQLLKLLLRTVALEKLALQKLVIQVRIDEQGNINLAELIPEPTKPEPEEKKPFQFQVKDFNLIDADIYYQDKRNDIDSNISGINFRLSGPLSLWQHEGKLNFQNAVVEVNDVKKQIQIFDLEFYFTKEFGQLENLRLEMNNSWLQAQASSNFKDSTLQGNVDGKIDLKDVSIFFPSIKRLEGIARLNGDANGKWNALVGNLSLTAPTVLFNELNIEDVLFNADFTGNSVDLTEFSADFADGGIFAKAQARIENSQTDYDAQLSVTSIQLQPLLSGLALTQKDMEAHEASELYPLTGQIQGKIKLTGSGTDWNRLSTSGQFELSKAKFNNTELLPSTINYTLQNDRLAANVNIDKIRADINGQLGLTQRTDLKVNITNIDLNRLTQFTQTAPDMAGMGELQADVTGELTNPKASASLTISDIAMNGARLGNADGRFVYSQNRVQIDELMLHNADTRGIVKGVVQLSDNANVDVKISLNPLQVSEYTSLASDSLDLKGQILGEIDVHGNFNALNGSGEFITKDLRAFSMPIDTAIPVKLNRGVVQIPQFALKTPSGNISLNAMYNPEGEYEFQLNSENLNLADTFGRFGIEQFKGYGQVTASGKGTISKPKAQVHIDLKSIQYNNVYMGDIVSTGYFEAKRFNFNASGFSQAFKLEGQIDAVDSMPFNANVQLDNLDLGFALITLADADENRGEMDGEITGIINVDGEIANIVNSRGMIQLQSVALQTPHHLFFNDTPIEIEYADKTVYLKQFEILQQTQEEPYSALSMRGQISKENFDFTVQSNASDLSILNDFIAGEENNRKKSEMKIEDIYGIGKFRFHLTGSHANPELVFNWNFADISLETSISNLESPTSNIPINSRGEITYRDKLLTINSIQLALYSNSLNLNGVVPIDLAEFPLNPPQNFQSLLEQRLTSPMHIRLTASNWDIQFLNQFIPAIEKAGGYVNVNLEASGKLGSPQVSGDIRLDDISLQSHFIQQPIENLSAAIDVNSDLMKVTTADEGDVAWLNCNLDYLKWNIGESNYAASGNFQYLSVSSGRADDKSTSWFEEDLISSIKDSIEKPKVALTFQGENIDFDTLVVANLIEENGEKLPLDGHTSMVATLNGKGTKLQDYTASIELEPFVLILGDYDLRNTEKIEITFQDGQLKFESIQLKSHPEPTTELTFAGSVNLDRRFDIKAFIHQFNLKSLSSLITDIPSMEGLVSIWVDASGAITNPEGLARFELQNIHVKDIKAVEGDINVNSIQGSIAFKDGLLRLNSTSLRAYESELSFHGTIPLNLPARAKTAPTKIDVDFDQRMQISIKGDKINLTPFAVLIPVVEQMKGTADIDMVLRSAQITSNAEPQDDVQSFFMNHYLEGNLTIVDGQIKLANVDMPIESIKLDIIAEQSPIDENNLENPNQNGNEIKLNELSFKVGTGKYTMTAKIKADGLMPKLYDGTVDINKFPIDFVASNFGREKLNNLSGYISMNANTKVTAGDLLKVLPTLQTEQKLAKLISAAMGSKMIFSEIRIKLADYSIYNTEQMSMSLSEDGFSLSGFKLNYQNSSAEEYLLLNAHGKWESNNQLEFEVGGALETQIIAEFTQLSNYLSNLKKSNNVESLISGLFEYSISVNGSASEPHITVSWPKINLELLGSYMDLSSAEISFEKGTLNIKAIELVTEGIEIGESQNINSVKIKGEIPFNLSFMPLAFSPSQKEFDLTVSVSIGELDSFPFLAMLNTRIDGNGNIDIKISNTLQSLQLSGDATLRNLIYQHQNVNLTDTYVKLRFNDNGITIEQVRGKFNNGSYSSSGTIDLSGYKLTNLNISGDWSDILWEQPGIVSATSEGSIKLLGTFDKPRLEGSVVVKNGTFEQSWRTIVEGLVGGQAKGRSYVILDYPLVENLELDLNVQIPQVPPNTFLLDTIGTQVQPKVNGRIVGPLNPPSQLVFVGQIDILEGEFAYLDRKFLIKSGTIENTNPYVFNPQYNINAELATPITNVQIPESQEPKDIGITLTLTGALQSPQPPVLTAEIVNPTPGEQYELNQLQILSLLAFGNITGHRREGAPFSVSETATDFIVRQAERFVGTRIASKLNLRELQLGIRDGETEPAKFRITKEIDSQLAITYESTYSLAAEPYLLGIEYRINKNFFIEGLRNQYGKYGVDFKYGIEW